MVHRRSFNFRGHAHELTFSCYRRSAFLNSDRSRFWFLDAVERARERHGIRLLAYVIMPEHAHVLLHPTPAGEPDPVPVEVILRSIKQPVAQRAVRWLRVHDEAFLERIRVTSARGRVEHRFWQKGGGYDRNLWSTRALWRAVDYLHLNPVRRGLCERPVDWEWSSARWYAGEGDVVLPMDMAPPNMCAGWVECGWCGLLSGCPRVRVTRSVDAESVHVRRGQVETCPRHPLL